MRNLRPFIITIALALAAPAFAQIPQLGGSMGVLLGDGQPIPVFAAEASLTMLVGDLLFTDDPFVMWTVNLGARFVPDATSSNARFFAELILFFGICAGAGFTAGPDGSSFNMMIGEIIPIIPIGVIVLYMRPIWESNGIYYTEVGFRLKVIAIPTD
jgi:hypothetical protein